jgi:hypothetical protein
VSISRYRSWELGLSRGTFTFDVLLNYPAIITELKPLGIGSKIIGPARAYSNHWDLRLENDPCWVIPGYVFPVTFGIAWSGIGKYPVHGGESDGFRWCVSCWLLVMLTAALPLHRIWQMRQRVVKRRRLANHLCLNCGYDLRATPGRCPECGALTARQGTGPIGSPGAIGLPHPPLNR